MKAHLDQLAGLIEQEREALLSRWRAQVRRFPSAQDLDVPTLNDHVPPLLDELAQAFRQISDEPIPQTLLKGSPPLHGLRRFHDGFDIVEVVAEYNILRACIHDLAASKGIPLDAKAFSILNSVLDEAIGLAVQTFATQQNLEVKQRREEYLSFVAHDLRTPLNAVALAAKLLEALLSQREGQRETQSALQTLHRNVRHLEVLVDRVLKENTNVQCDSGVKLERRTFDLWPFVEGLIHDLAPLAATEGTQILNEVPMDLVVYADAGLFRRVFQNLITNSITYTPRGIVRLGARASGAEGAIDCWVSDNGAGIPEDRFGVIFEKLETDPQKEGGTGLGLAIVKSFVEAHGGTVSVESKVGEGSTFRIHLPGKPGDARA